MIVTEEVIKEKLLTSNEDERFQLISDWIESSVFSGDFNPISMCEFLQTHGMLTKEWIEVITPCVPMKRQKEFKEWNNKNGERINEQMEKS